MVAPDPNGDGVARGFPGLPQISYGFFSQRKHLPITRHDISSSD